MSDHKPREFWILKQNIIDGNSVTELPDYPELFIHVIEKSAYDAIFKELDILKNNSIPLESFNVSIPSDEWHDTKKERDQLRAGLDLAIEALTTINKLIYQDQIWDPEVLSEEELAAWDRCRETLAKLQERK